MNDQLVVFKITAFRQECYLNLSPDSTFIAPNITPHSGSLASNSSATTDLNHCFYSGDVNADQESYAALSLCKGLQGAFSYQGMEYFINPLGNERTGGGYTVNTERRTHVIRRRGRDRDSSGNTTTNRCGVEPGLTQNLPGSFDKYKHMKGLEMDSLTETVLKSLGRSKRFASIPRFVEVLVVADESMAKFHGDDLKHYLLTLMSVAAKLYKHPSIMNYINIVVVGFMVINEAEKGPKVSTNAALTLRSFCSWQKHLNKYNDKHPEYWDTAVLFTKQVRSGNTVSTLFDVCVHAIINYFHLG
jgi:thrombospondin motif-containing protein 15